MTKYLNFVGREQIYENNMKKRQAIEQMLNVLPILYPC